MCLDCDKRFKRDFTDLSLTHSKKPAYLAYITKFHKPNRFEAQVELVHFKIREQEYDWIEDVITYLDLN